ncbi:MAG TPA: hypothetical protein PKA37_01375 [Planctomycetota bacterium]|jgi:hypothetical protein|nr:hypothetical protein [Planctomycetota bacterium]
MFWCFAGILLWLGGWWFTGRLFPAYRKAVFYENQEKRRRDPAAPLTPHSGPLLLLLFDFGLLLSGVRGLIEWERALFAESPGANLETLSPGAADIQGLWAAVPYAPVFLLYALRSMKMLQDFYTDQLKSVGIALERTIPRTDGPFAALVGARPGARVLIVVAAAVAISAPVLIFRGTMPRSGSTALALLWLALPMLLVIFALFPTILSLRGDSLRQPESRKQSRPTEKASVP